MNRERQLVWLTVITALAGLAIRYWLHQPPPPTDDLAYFYLAQQAETAGDPSPDRLRLVLIAFVKVFIALLGPTVEAFYAAVAANALLSLLAVVVFTAVMGNRLTVLLMTLLWATSLSYLTVDTRLLPDNLGSSLTLLGLAAVVWGGGDRQPVTNRGRWRPVLALPGGLLLWSAYAVRANFAVFLLPALLYAWGSRGIRLPLLTALIAGLLGGVAVETTYFAAHYQDPWLSFHLLSRYRDRLVVAGRAEQTPEGLPATTGEVATTPAETAAAQAVALATPPQGPKLTWTRFLGRYFIALTTTGSAEVFLLVLGWMGFGWWGWRLWAATPATPSEEPPRLHLKLSALLLAYGVIALAVVSWRPLIPVMTESVRYYATCAPWFYLAAVEGSLGLAALLASNRSRLAPLLVHAPRMAIAGLVGLAGFNLYVAQQTRDAVKNGNDAIFHLTRAIREAAAGQPGMIFQDKHSNRVTRLYLPPREGWRYVSSLWNPEREPPYRLPTFAILDWRRANYNVITYGYHTFLMADLTPLSTMTLMMRHRHGRYFTDLFAIPEVPLVRLGDDWTDHLPTTWTILATPDGPARGERLATEGTLVMDHEATLLVSGSLEGGSLMVPPEPSTPLPDRRFFQLSFQVPLEQPITELSATLLRYRSDGTLVRQELGEMGINAQRPGRQHTLWTYLPEESRAWRVLLRRGKAPPLTLQHLTVQLLRPAPGEEPRQVGGAW